MKCKKNKSLLGFWKKERDTQWWVAQPSLQKYSVLSILFVGTVSDEGEGEGDGKVGTRHVMRHVNGHKTDFGNVVWDLHTTRQSE